MLYMYLYICQYMLYTESMTSSSADSAQLWVLATHLHDLSRTINRVLPTLAALEPLPASEMAAILSIHSDPGITLTALAAQLGMRQSNTSAVVRGLVERGLVRREKSPGDLRVVLLHPTESALRDIDSVQESWSKTLGEALQQLPPNVRLAILGASEALGALNSELRAG